MKAIVVFDVNNRTFEAIKEYFTGDITLHLGNDRFYDFEGVELKPMSQKKKDYEEEINHNDDFYEKGWNDCIDEILGE